VPVAQAASQTWSPTASSADWTNPVNWLGNAVPGIVNANTTDVVTFNTALAGGTVGGLSDPILNDNQRAVRSILFDTADVGPYVIGTVGGNQLQLWHLGNVTMTSAVVNAQVINAPVLIRVPSSTNAVYSFVNNSTTTSATLTFNSVTNNTANTRPLTLTLDGSNTGANTIGTILTAAGAAGAVVLVKQGTGTWVLPGANELVQKTSAGVPAAVQVNGGTLVVQNAASLGTITLPVINAGTLQIDNVTLNQNALALNEGGTIRMNGSGTVNGVTVGATAANVGLATTSAADVLTVGNAPNKLTGGQASTVMAVSGAGTVVLSQPSNYLGSWLFNGGITRLDNATALGTPALGYNLSFGAGSTAILQLNSYSITTNSLTTNASAGTPKVENGFAAPVTLTVNNSSANTFAGILRDGAAGTLALAKGAGGVLTLSGANTLSGGTTVTGGTLKVANLSGSATGTGAVSVNGTNTTLTGPGSIGGVVTMGAGAILAPGDGVGSITLGSLSLASGSVLDWEFNPTPANDLATVTALNGLTVNGGGFHLYQENTQTAFSTAGTYHLISFSGTIGGTGVNALSVLNPSAGFNYAFGASGGFVTLTITSSGLTATWNASGGGNWGTAANWTPGEPNAATATASFGGAITTPSTVTLDANKVVSGIVFNSSNAYTIAPATSQTLTVGDGAGGRTIQVLDGSHTMAAPLVLASNVTADVIANRTLTVSGAISGAGSLTKSSNGILALTQANSYAGGTVVNGGTLSIANSAALSNGTILFNGGTVRANTAGLVITNAIQISNGAIGAIDTNGQTFTLSGLISDTTTNGALAKTGAGTLVLTGTNSYSGGTSVSGGIVSLDNSNALGTGPIQFAATSTLTAPNPISLANAITLADGITATIDTGSQSVALNGNIAGTGGSMTKVGTGTLVLGGANTFGTTGSGAFNLNAGTVQLANPGATAPGLVLNFGGGTLDLNANSVNATSLAGTGTITDTGLGFGTSTLTVNQVGNTTFAGGITNGATQLVALTKSGAGTLTLTGTSNFGGAALVNGGLVRVEAGASLTTGNLNITNNSQITVAGGTLAMPGNAALSNTGSTTAILEVQLGSTINLGSMTAPGNQNNGYFYHQLGGTATVGTVTLGRSALNFTAEPFEGSITQGFYLQGGTFTTPGAFNMGTAAATNSSVSVRVDAGAIFNLGGPLTIGLNNGGRWSIFDVNGGSFTSADAGSGILIGGPSVGSAKFVVQNNGTATAERISLSQFGAATSSLNVVSGSLYVGSGGIVADPANLGTLFVQFGTATIGAKADWSSNLPITLGGVTTFNAADLSNVAHNILLNGPLTGNGLTKTGDGLLVLGGTNTYFGPTTVDAGTLLIHGNSSGSVITVNAGTLGGNGTAGSVTVLSGATLAPGTGVESLEIAGTLSILGAAKFTLEIDTNTATADVANVTGAFSLDPTHSVILSVTDLGGNAVLAPGTVFPFIDYPDGGWNGGLFAGRADDSIFVLGANTFRISYNGPDNAMSAVTLQVVPEPSTTALLTLLLPLVAARRRRRSR
jgi:autotransporter-associated beta strand protein